MAYPLNKKQLIGLIDLAKNEILDQALEKTGDLTTIANLHENQMQMTMAMSVHLVAASRMHILPPVKVALDNFVGDIHSTLLGNDPFTTKVLTKLRKHAMYFHCFAGTLVDFVDFPEYVVEQAKALLVVKTQSVRFTELNLRFSNLTILAEYSMQDKVEFTHGDFTIIGEKVMNGSTPYFKFFVRYNNPVYAGNNYEITKGFYSYEFGYVYLSNTLRNSMNFTNNDGAVMEVPEGLFPALDALIMKMVNECFFINEFSASVIVYEPVARITLAFKSIVDTCMTKFDSAEELTYEQKLSAIGSYILNQLQYKNVVNINGQAVFNLAYDAVRLSEDKESLVLEPDVHTYTKVDNTYNRVKMKYVFDHLHGDKVLDILTKEDEQVQIFNYYILTYLAKELQDIARYAQDITRLKKFGSVY